MSFLPPARDHALLAEASLRRQVDEQHETVNQLKEDVTAMKQQLCRSQEEMLHSGLRHPSMAAADCDQGTRQSSDPIAMQQSETCSEIWSHTFWLEISEREALVTNSLSKISAGGTDSPEPCCYLQESLFLAEDKGKYIPGFALYEGCKISAADGTVIRVRKVPELHRAEKTLILRAGSAVLQVTRDHRIALPTGDTVHADSLRIGQDVMVQNSPTQLTRSGLARGGFGASARHPVKRAGEEGPPPQPGGAPLPGGSQHP